MKHALERTLIVAAFPVLMAGVALPAEYTLGPLDPSTLSIEVF
jgi:hypothetical protein